MTDKTTIHELAAKMGKTPNQTAIHFLTILAAEIATVDKKSLSIVAIDYAISKIKEKKI